MKPPKWRSSTQCAAVRTTRGEITVPVQAKPWFLPVWAATKASEGKSALPPTIDACAPGAAAAAVGATSAVSSAQKVPSAAALPVRELPHGFIETGG